MPEINGTWKLNNTLILPDTGGEDYVQEIPFRTTASVEGISLAAICDAMAVNDGDLYYRVTATDPAIEDITEPTWIPVYYHSQWMEEMLGPDIKTVIFPASGAEVTQAFYNIITANAEEIPPAAQILYKGKVIAAIMDGQKATIKCANKKFDGDLIVRQMAASAVIDWENIPEVDSIENPTTTSPTAVKYNGEIYLLVKEA